MNCLGSNTRYSLGSVLLLLSSFHLLFCNVSAQEKPAPLKIVVPIEPYRYLVEQIGGEHVEVMSAVPDGADPHHYSITGKQMKFVGAADVYFSIRLPFEMQIRERLLQTSSAEIVELVAPVAELKENHADHDHYHSHDHGHDHGKGIDPHVWTDPVQVMDQVAEIRDVLTDRIPQQRSTFRNHADALQMKLSDIDQRFGSFFKKTTADHVLVYHPAWGHFCERYGLHQVSLEQEGKPIAAKAYAATLRSLSDAYFPVILVQPQISERLSIQISKQVGFEVVEVDPLSYDYLEMLEALYRSLSDTIEE